MNRPSCPSTVSLTVISLQAVKGQRVLFATAEGLLRGQRRWIFRAHECQFERMSIISRLTIFSFAHGHVHGDETNSRLAREHTAASPVLAWGH